MANVFNKFFGWVSSLFSNPKVEQAFRTADQIAQVAEPIVQQINAIAPNKTLTEVLAAYDKFGVPVVKGFSGDDPTVIGAMLLNLATTQIQKKYPSLPANLIQTGIQVAVTAVKAGAVSKQVN